MLRSTPSRRQLPRSPRPAAPFDSCVQKTRRKSARPNTAESKFEPVLIPSPESRHGSMHPRQLPTGRSRRSEDPSANGGLPKASAHPTRSRSEILSRVGVVVIGRNEGERLRRCLQSVGPSAQPTVYVDSGSTDGSPESARSLGAHVVLLDLAI